MDSRKIFTVLILIALAAFVISCDRSGNAELVVKGDEIKQKVVEYKAQTGRLPSSLADLGIEEKLEGPIYYEIINDERFRLSFGAALGESVVYDSSTNKWE